MKKPSAVRAALALCLVVLPGLSVSAAAETCQPLKVEVMQLSVPAQEAVTWVELVACGTVKVQVKATGGVPPYTYAFGDATIGKACNNDGRCISGVPCATTIDPRTGVVVFRVPRDPLLAGVVCQLPLKATDSCPAGRQSAETSIHVAYNRDKCAGPVSIPPDKFVSLKAICQVVGCNGPFKPWVNRVNPSDKARGALASGRVKPARLAEIRDKAVALTNQMRNATAAEFRQVEAQAGKLMEELQRMGL